MTTTPASRLAAAPGYVCADGRRSIKFDPRQPGAYIPTDDLDELGAAYDVAVVRGASGKAWFEARYRHDSIAQQDTATPRSTA